MHGCSLTGWAAIIYLFCIFYFVCFKVPATFSDPAIEADYLIETEGVFVVVHMDRLVGQFVKDSNWKAYVNVSFSMGMNQTHNAVMKKCCRFTCVFGFARIQLYACFVLIIALYMASCLNIFCLALWMYMCFNFGFAVSV